jgi:D-amino-acid dehydrogenase
MKKCVVIGGGVIGLCSAYYLAKAGHKVTVLDKSDMTDGCSYGNAGMVTPSHVIPLAQPGMISKGIRWMFDSRSPFYVKPRANRELISWGRKFYKNSNQGHVRRSVKPLYELLSLGKDLYKEMSTSSDLLSFTENGLLMLFQSDKVGEEERKAAKIAEEVGLEVDYLNKNDILKLETGLETAATGGVHYVGDAHMSPNQFMTFIKQELTQMGVELISNQLVEDFENSGNKIVKIKTGVKDFNCDEVVLCAGAWSPLIAKKMGIKFNLLPGKGYSFNLDKSSNQPTIPTILCEGKVAVTPFENQLRFGGTMEITHTKNNEVNMKRVEGIVNTVNQFYPNLNVELPNRSDVWAGFRPCTPTGLPIISRNSKVDNLIVATGHAMMGLSLAPATGKIVEEIISEKKLSLDIGAFQ